MSKFTIDFFELSFLAEACIPPRPIARSMFWYDLIDKHYNIMSVSERNRLFEWIQKNSNFDLKNEDCQWFYDRFNPDNQFDVHTDFKKKKEVVECFKHNDKYYIKRNTFIAEEYIDRVDKSSRQIELDGE